MKLRSKFIFILLIGGFATVLSIFLLSNLFIKSNALKIENMLARKDVERVHSALSNYQQAIHLLNKDWGFWDDSYKFVEDLNEGYVKSNLMEATFDQLRMNFIAFYDLKGNFKYGKFYDLKNKEFIPFPKSIEQRITSEIKALRTETAKEGASGIICANSDHLIISLRPILKSDYTGPSRGTIVMGFYFTQADIDKLAKSTNLQLTFYSIVDINKDNKLRNAFLHLMQGTDPYITTESNQLITSLYLDQRHQRQTHWYF